MLGLKKENKGLIIEGGNIIKNEIDDLIEKEPLNNIIEIDQKKLIIIPKFFGLGKCGVTIGKKLKEETKVEIFSADLALSEAQKTIGGITMLLDIEGTGRNPIKGEEKVKSKIDELDKILSGFVENADLVSIIVGCGGGSGTGYFFNCLNLLLRKGKNIICFVIVPDNNEGTKEKVNSNNFISRLIDDYMANYKKSISTFLISNEYLLKMYNQGLNKYERVNEEIVFAIKQVFNIGNSKNYLNSSKDLDISDIKRVLFGNINGFLDVMKMNLVLQKREIIKNKLKEENENGIGENGEKPKRKKKNFLDLFKLGLLSIKVKSMFFGNWNFKDVYSFVGFIELPNEFEEDKKIELNNFVDNTLRGEIYKFFNTKNGLISYGYSNTKEVVGYFLVNGLMISKEIEKLNISATREVGKILSKQENRNYKKIDKIIF